MHSSANQQFSSASVFACWQQDTIQLTLFYPRLQLGLSLIVAGPSTFMAPKGSVAWSQSWHWHYITASTLDRQQKDLYLEDIEVQEDEEVLNDDGANTHTSQARSATGPLAKRAYRSSPQQDALATFLRTFCPLVSFQQQFSTSWLPVGYQPYPQAVTRGVVGPSKPKRITYKALRLSENMSDEKMVPRALARCLRALARSC
ncbi:hypothetical protein AXG93_857s1380 [Marchantia polymorpha subsp. ruderalis]|uniref:Uncharacterized protein n=1 Tax=Marchantia polymorpha subsp. ruderalis TaxID=1480154 RepID=A0A176WEY3_MARPO|nr:hypothetical protein AXG93_857s1380 [Marchantia polymorpha subsp. ruderalis]